MDSCVKRVAILIVFTSVVLCQGAPSDQNSTPTIVSIENATMSTTPNNSSSESLNDTVSYTGNVTSPDIKRPDTNGLLQRSLYVAVGISAIVAIYFIVRTVKTSGRRKAKKYGVIHGTGSTELQPLDKDVEEEEEDMTLFDRKDIKWPR